MATKTKDKGHVYGEVNNEADLRRIFNLIRQDVEKAKSREQLTELYRRAGYLVTLTRSPAWKKKFGADEADELMEVGEREFTKRSAPSTLAPRRSVRRRATTKRGVSSGFPNRD